MSGKRLVMMRHCLSLLSEGKKVAIYCRNEEDLPSLLDLEAQIRNLFPPIKGNIDYYTGDVEIDTTCFRTFGELVLKDKKRRMTIRNIKTS